MEYHVKMPRLALNTACYRRVLPSEQGDYQCKYNLLLLGKGSEPRQGHAVMTRSLLESELACRELVWKFQMALPFAM